MMQKQMGAIFLVAGTCMGSGMIALPIVLAQLGVVPGVALMLLIWSLMYYTSLINLELNLQSGQGRPLGELGEYYAGPIAKAIGLVSLKVLSYALLAVYLYGGASILQKLLASNQGGAYSFSFVVTGCALLSMALLLLQVKWIDYINRVLFIGLLVVVGILIVGLLYAIDWTDLPLFSKGYGEVSTWSHAIPVIFTAFGFQVIFHTLTNYCLKDARMLKRAFLWGSLIPALVYITWTCSILAVVHHESPLFYQQMLHGDVEVGDLIEVLSAIAPSQSVQLLVWWISLLAIFTSLLGVGVGLCDSLKGMMADTVPNSALRTVLAALISVLPAYLIALLVPNAFISVLGFAGMILTVIAILLPVYLFRQLKEKGIYYPEVNSKLLVALSVIGALIVIASELFNAF